MARSLGRGKKGQERDLSTEVTQADISQGLRELGLTAGDGVMVHSSLRSFGRVAGGARAVVEALCEVLTPDGTLLMPSFNHGELFKAGQPGYFSPVESRTTNGAIPDLFWRLPNVYRSLNPTHSFAAWGMRAHEYTEWHHRTLTTGADSPLGRLWRDGGYGLLLGVSYRANTFHHVTEILMNAPCLGKRTEAYPIVLPDGRRVESRTWGWRERGCPLNGPALYGDFMSEGGLDRRVRIGECEAVLFRLDDCFDVVSELLAGGTRNLAPCKRCEIKARRIATTVESDWDEERNCLRADSAAWGY